MSIYNPPRKGSTSTEDTSGSFYTKGQADNRFVHLTGDETINGEKTFEDDTKINGNLNVTGTVAENLRIEDNLITLNFGETADGITLGTAGIEIDRGTATDGYLVLAENVTGNNADNRWVLDIGDGNAKSVFYDNFPDSASFDNAFTRAALDVPQTFTAGQRGEVTALSDGANISIDLDASNNFSVTLGGNRQLDNPTNAVAGQSGRILVTQDATGSRTLSYDTNYVFACGTAPTLTTDANAVDMLVYEVISATEILLQLVADIQ